MSVFVRHANDLHDRQHSVTTTTTSRRITSTSGRSSTTSGISTHTTSSSVIATTSVSNTAPSTSASSPQPAAGLPINTLAAGLSAGLAITIAAVVAFWCWARSRRKALDQGKRVGDQPRNSFQIFTFIVQVVITKHKSNRSASSLSTHLGLSLDLGPSAEKTLKFSDSHPSYFNEAPLPSPRRLTKLSVSSPRAHLRKKECCPSIPPRSIPSAHSVTSMGDPSPTLEETSEVAALISSTHTSVQKPKHQPFPANSVSVHSMQIEEKKKIILPRPNLGSLCEEFLNGSITAPCGSGSRVDPHPSSGWISRLPRPSRLRTTSRHSRLSRASTASVHGFNGLTPKASTISSASWYSTQSAEEHQKRVHPSFILAALGKGSDEKEAPVSQPQSSWGGPSRLSQISAATVLSQHGTSIGLAIGGEEQV
jgi:hypothetical protein